MKLDRKLDFFIVGAQKAGTSSLYQYLAQHQGIFLPKAKDFFAFNEDAVYGVPASKLEAYYRAYAGQARVGGSNVQIMPFPEAVRNLHAYNPDIQLIAMLRNPVDRAYSAYWMMRRTGREPCATFEAALAEDLRRARCGGFREKAELCYLEHGNYVDQLSLIYRYFDRERVFVGLFDDLVETPEKVTRAILRRLDLNTSDLGIDFSKAANEASMPRSMILQRIIKGQSGLKKVYRSLAPLGLQVRANDAIFTKLEERNLKPVRYPPMAPETRAKLAAHFRPANEKLSALLGRDLSHWH